MVGSLAKLKGVALIIIALLIGCTEFDTNDSDFGASNYGPTDYSRAAKFNLQLGLGYLEQGDVERAKLKLLKAVEQAPKMPEVHYNIAHFYYLIDEYDQADKHFKLSINHATNSGKESTLGTAHNNYGVFLCQTKRFKEADKQFKIAIANQRYADTASAYENAGTCAMKAGDKKQAKYYFNKTIKQNPLSTKALLEMSELHFNDAEYDKAKFRLERYNQLTNNSYTNKRAAILTLKLAKLLNDKNMINEVSGVIMRKYPDVILNNDEQYSKVVDSVFNNKLVKYTDIGELKIIS